MWHEDVINNASITGDVVRQKWSSRLENKFVEESWKMNGYAVAMLCTNIPAGTTRTEFEKIDVVRYAKTPTIIFCSEDDEVVGYQEQERFAESLRRANCLSRLVKYPIGCGGHHSVDSTITKWYATQSEFDNALASASDGIYLVGYLDNPKWIKVVNHVATTVTASEDITPKVNVVETKSGVVCHDVAHAWVESVKFFNQFM